MIKDSEKLRINKLSHKIGLMIIVTQIVALIALGVFYINRFTNQIDEAVSQKFGTPGYLMSKGMLRYQTVQDKATMESIVGEVIDNCMIIGANGKVYYSLEKQYEDKEIDQIPFLNAFPQLKNEERQNQFIEKDEATGTYLYTLSPLRLDDGRFLGYLFVKAKMERIVVQKRSIIAMFFIGSILCIILTSAVILLLLNRWFTVKIEVIVESITSVANGKTVNLLEANEKDEIGLIKHSINELIKGTESRVVFANEIAKGNFDVEYEMLSDDDTAGKSLLNMRENLKHAQEQEVERMKEVEIQNWITRGLAKFADTLRQDNDNIKKLASNFIIELINYTKVTQGALFVKNDIIPDDTYYEVAAAVAYNREKILEAKFRLGEGLIGRAAYEKLTIYMTDVPQNYVKITSGLGESNPNCILLVPLVSDDDVVGVIELVSFNEFEPYQIEFVEKLAVNMASTIVNVRVNERTMTLLNESRKQREELMAQEEEVRQNLEEMTAIKEEAARKEEEMNTVWRAVKEENCVAIYETSGHIIEANNQFVETFANYIKDRAAMNIKEVEKAGFNSETDFINFCNRIDAGRSQRVDITIEKDGVKVRLVQSHVPMRNSNGIIDKIMSIGMVV